MKKIAAIFFIVCFLFSNLGLTISAHWCGSHLAHIGVLTTSSYKCTCGQIEGKMKSDCCTERSTVLFAKTDITYCLQSLKIEKSIKCLTAELFPNFIVLSGPESRIYSLNYHLPRFKPKVPIYLLDCSFTI